jgi:hypothetical protein
MKRSFKHISIAIVLGSLLACITGCEQVRKLTYPQDFTYIEDKEVKQLMHKLGLSISRIHELAADEPPAGSEAQQEVIKELTNMETIATRLSGGHKQTNQFVIGEHIEGFIGDLGMAKMYARMDPPRYSKIEKVTNGCAKCHQFR